MKNLFIIIFLTFLSCDKATNSTGNKLKIKDCNQCLIAFNDCDYEINTKTQTCLTKKIDSLKYVNENLLAALHAKIRTLEIEDDYKNELIIKLDNKIGFFSKYQSEEISFFNSKYNDSGIATSYNLEMITYNLCFLNNKLVILNSNF
tara:strand:- start:114 stop:554 length:441 start_codon:yes stop_codon:yes gene_type:complete